jgi:hypothetical protein
MREHELHMQEVIRDEFFNDLRLRLRKKLYARLNEKAEESLINKELCFCRACIKVRDEGKDIFDKEEHRRMILCVNCGCKRCPHANDHNNACTGSNESGQIGSANELMAGKLMTK